MKKNLSLLILSLFSLFVGAQNSFKYRVELNPITIENLPGLHSYAFGQHDGKWLIIGGRKDGLHARQPFNAFTETNNNSTIYVIDVDQKQFWSTSVNVLATGLKEQLQSTNMNFYQDNDTLFIIGGYAFSPTANNHITFPYLTSVSVSSVISAIINGDDITPFFKQITDDKFAITGGQLGKIDNTYYLVGGHRFDGRYNPMGPDHGPGFTQVYSNQIRKFSINNSGSGLSYSNYSTITDEVHLRRRDYNLLPQIFSDGTFGYTISSGVFQKNADLPFLYPVDINKNGYSANTDFNQYLSNYHSAKAVLYDSLNNQTHTIFFGGMSQYYVSNGTLIKDDNVPFVKTISLLSRYDDNTLHEFQLPTEMPGLKGASAEFIVSKEIPHFDSEIIKLSDVNQNEFVIGYIYGGILSPKLNPFTSNETSSTSADPTIYEVKLIRDESLTLDEVKTKNPYDVEIYPNPNNGNFTIKFYLDSVVDVYYLMTNSLGEIVRESHLKNTKVGDNKEVVKINRHLSDGIYFITVVFNNENYITKKIIKE
jgi:hypothetical protein